MHYDYLKPCPTATADKPAASDTVRPPPADDSITEDTLQAAPIGTHLEIVEAMDSHFHEQQRPSPQLLVPIVPSRQFPPCSRQPPDRFGEPIPI